MFLKHVLHLQKDKLSENSVTAVVYTVMVLSEMSIFKLGKKYICKRPPSMCSQ